MIIFLFNFFLGAEPGNNLISLILGVVGYGVLVHLFKVSFIMVKCDELAVLQACIVIAFPRLDVIFPLANSLMLEAHVSIFIHTKTGQGFLQQIFLNYLLILELILLELDFLHLIVAALLDNLENGVIKLEGLW